MRNTYSKQEKLKSKKLIDLLFEQGRSVKSFPLRMVFIETPLPIPDIPRQVGISVSKRNHKLAVTRNHIKRQIREAYRTNKSLIDTKGTTFALLILYTSPQKISQQDIDKAMVKLIKRFNEANISKS